MKIIIREVPHYRIFNIVDDNGIQQAKDIKVRLGDSKAEEEARITLRKIQKIS